MLLFSIANIGSGTLPGKMLLVRVIEIKNKKRENNLREGSKYLGQSAFATSILKRVTEKV